MFTYCELLFSGWYEDSCLQLLFTKRNCETAKMKSPVDYKINYVCIVSKTVKTFCSQSGETELKSNPTRVCCSPIVEQSNHHTLLLMQQDHDMFYHLFYNVWKNELAVLWTFTLNSFFIYKLCKFSASVVWNCSIIGNIGNIWLHDYMH